jgi:hypothetical protein
MLWEFETGGNVKSSPAIGSDGTVYVGSRDKKLYALSGKSGVKLWEFETGSLAYSFPAIGSGGTVYVGSVDNKLYAINGKSGVKLWEFETGGNVESSPAIGSDGTVYVGSHDFKLYAIRTDSKGPAKSPWPMRGQNARHTGRAPQNYLKQGLVAHYPFDNHAKDITPNGYHASGSVGYTSDRFQRPNGAIQITNRRVNLPPSVIRKTAKSGAISLWFRRSKDQSSYGFVFYSIEGRKFNTVFIKLTNTGQLEAFIGSNSAGSKIGKVAQTQLDNWHHVVLLWRNPNNDAELYMDGVSLGKNHNIYVWTGAAQNGSTLLGADKKAYDGNTATGIPIQLDDLRIYDRALSAEEIEALFDLEKQKSKDDSSARPNNPEANAAIEAAIRKAAGKPPGTLTKADLEKVTNLYLNDNQLTEVPKGLEKLTQLKHLSLHSNQLTDVTGLEKLTQLTTLLLQNNPDLTKAQIDQLQKALPKCKITHNATK